MEVEKVDVESEGALPPYLNMLFASINANGVGEADSILLFTALPPLGWTRYSNLDNRLPRGASTAGGTGGSSSHTHSVTIHTSGSSATSTAGGGLLNTSTMIDACFYLRYNENTTKV